MPLKSILKKFSKNLELLEIFLKNFTGLLIFNFLTKEIFKMSQKCFSYKRQYQPINILRDNISDKQMFVYKI